MNGGAVTCSACGDCQRKHDKKEVSSWADSITFTKRSYMGLPFAEDYLPFVQGHKRKGRFYLG